MKYEQFGDAIIAPVIDKIVPSPEAALADVPDGEIGRASCRERV